MPFFTPRDDIACIASCADEHVVLLTLITAAVLSYYISVPIFKVLICFTSREPLPVYLRALLPSPLTSNIISLLRAFDGLQIHACRFYLKIVTNTLFNLLLLHTAAGALFSSLLRCFLYIYSAALYILHDIRDVHLYLIMRILVVDDYRRTAMLR